MLSEQEILCYNETHKNIGAEGRILDPSVARQGDIFIE
jgi:hypothetical protein